MHHHAGAGPSTPRGPRPTPSDTPEADAGPTRKPLAELAARKGRPCQGRTAPTGDYKALTFFFDHAQLVNRADRDSSGTEVGCFARLHATLNRVLASAASNGSALRPMAKALARTSNPSSKLIVLLVRLRM